MCVGVSGGRLLEDFLPIIRAGPPPATGVILAVQVLVGPKSVLIFWAGSLGITTH